MKFTAFLKTTATGSFDACSCSPIKENFKLREVQMHG